MDFYGLKRKDLQALCKKHDIPANLTNLEMANKLTSLLKEAEKPLAEGGSCLKRKDEKIGGNDSDVENIKSKKARLSSEKENVGLENLVRSRVRSVRKKVDEAVENVDTSESSRRILEKPVRVRRSTVQKPVEDDEVTDSNPPVEKKRVRRTVKDVNKTTDKPLLPPPTAVEFSDNALSEEPKLSKRRSMRKSPNPCVENTRDKPPLPPAKPPLQPPAVAGFSGGPANEESGLPKRRLVRKKREGNVAKDVNISDNAPPLQPPILPPPPPPTAVEFFNNEDEDIGVPKRRSLRKRGVVVEKNENTSDEPPLPPPVPPPTSTELPKIAAKEEPILEKRRSMKNKVVIESNDVTNLNTSDNSAVEETQLAKRRLLRNREIANSKNIKSPMPSNSVSKVRKPLQQLPTNIGNGTPNLVVNKKCNAGIEKTRKTTRRSLRNKENVADFVILTKNAEDSNQVPKESNVEEIYSLKEEPGKNEKVKKQRITRSKSQLTVKVDSEIRSKEVLQLEEPLQHKRRNQNKRKCDEKRKEPLKGYIRNCRENDMALHFTNRAGDTESTGNLIDSVSQVGQARGGVVFWCNGSGCFALPKW